MLKTKYSIVCLLFITSILYAQFPPAIEQWSVPVRIDSFSILARYEAEACFNDRMDSVYFFRKNGISFSTLIDSVWSSPLKLNSNINNGQPIRRPSISRDGKRLYFSRWGGYGSWDLWYSEWSNSNQHWGPSINLGPQINSPSIEYYALEISPDTLYTIDSRWGAGGVCIFIKDSINNTWQIVDSSNYNHPFGYGDTRGVSITGNRKKAYFSKYVFGPPDTLQSELFVTYRDTILNRWGATYKLNINSTAFQPTGSFGYIGGWDEYPWISPNGKTLVFTSNRDAAREDTIHIPDLYVSHLLVDENGDTVTSVKKSNDITISSYTLFQNHPNPFNSSTLISYQIPNAGMVTLKVYDILGREVKTLVNDFKTKGRYEVTFNADALASGLYIYEITSGDYKASKKMTLIK